MRLNRENTRLASELLKRAKHCDEFERAIQDADNRDRHLNLQLVGLNKWLEGGNLRELAHQPIKDVLGVQLANNEAQRVYQPWSPVLDVSSVPRPVIVRFHSLLERDCVMAAVRGKYRSKTELQWRGFKIACFLEVTKACS